MDVVVLAHEQFPEDAKTAVGVLRYADYDVVAVLDRDRAGDRVGDHLPDVQDAPIVGSVADAPDFDALLVGIAPIGGGFDDSWRPDVRTAIERGELGRLGGALDDRRSGVEVGEVVVDGRTRRPAVEDGHDLVVGVPQDSDGGLRPVRELLVCEDGDAHTPTDTVRKYKHTTPAGRPHRSSFSMTISSYSRSSSGYSPVSS